jgi:photosystem II stability/assembly factor-like uncharacterized protein
MSERRQAFAVTAAVVTGIAIGALIWWLRAPVVSAATVPTVNGDAALLTGAAQAPILAATRAGNRLIAVGEHGVVLLSDDDGQHWRQAQTVPTQALLTGVNFVDAQQGWAVGHDGVILHSDDGGEHWIQQRQDLSTDKPLMAVRFTDATHGIAVGLFSLALRTEDGGATWTPFELVPGSSDDKHLYAIFGDGNVLCIAAEAGAVYRSLDAGASWSLIQTSNIGSFWTGAALPDGRLLLAGQRGHVFVSDDHGASWSEVASGTQQSLTAILPTAGATLEIVGLAGVELHSADAGSHFSVSALPDRLPLLAMVATQKGEVLHFGSSGPVALPATPPSAVVP